MKCINILLNKQKRAAWCRAFNLWQKRPHEMKELSEERHKCNSCGTEYTGNYCPRCGQSAKVGRFTFKAALEQFMDILNMGNRSFFRTAFELMLRPGYVIRDYLKGMRSAYFPPFSMFFILAAFSILVEHGFTFNTLEFVKKDGNVVLVDKEENAQGNFNIIDYKQWEEIRSNVNPTVKSIVKILFYPLMSFYKNNPTLFSLLWMIIGSLPLFFFFRHSPNFPDLYFSEFLVALVYTSNAYSIFQILGNLLSSAILGIISILIIFVSFKQMSGYRNGYVLLYIGLTALITGTIFVGLVLAAASLLSLI